MKKIAFDLVLIALFGIAAAYTNKPLTVGPKSLHKYSYWYTTTDGSKIYYGFDLTSLGYTQGLDYDCVTPAATCTFDGDPTRAHSDLGGQYFFSWDVPVSGFNNTGTFCLFD